MKTVMMLLVVMILAILPPAVYSQEQPPPIPSQEVPEVMTRGPVNEAFAQPVNMQNQAGLIAPTAPPANINEIPPAERPAGDEFSWIPGYWAWDSDANGYIWVSGCWRAVPAGMSWTPGYWTQVPGGWQWVAGYWAPVNTQAVEYLPEPPAVTQVAPPAPAPAPNQTWVPPFWYWHHGQYVLRPGYWIVAQPDWVWVPSSYIWTPRGYLFVPGHWDYALDRRGVLFAPVHFPPRMVAHPGFSYGLSVVVNLGNLQFSLFTRPKYHHYYFGDYYDPVYIRMGIFPRYACEHRHDWYDPIYVHDRWRHHRQEPKWEQYERREYERRREHRDLRPPRTYREMERRMEAMPPAKRNQFDVAAPITRVASQKSSPLRFERTRPEANQQISRHTHEVRKFVDERSRRESGDRARKGGQPSSPVKISPSPVNRREPAGRSNQPAPPSAITREGNNRPDGRAMGTPNKHPETRSRTAPPDQSPFQDRTARNADRSRTMGKPDSHPETRSRTVPPDQSPFQDRTSRNGDKNRTMGKPDSHPETRSRTVPPDQSPFQDRTSRNGDKNRTMGKPDSHPELKGRPPQAEQSVSRERSRKEASDKGKRAPEPSPQEQQTQKETQQRPQGDETSRAPRLPWPMTNQKNGSGHKGAPPWPTEQRN